MTKKKEKKKEFWRNTVLLISYRKVKTLKKKVKENCRIKTTFVQVRITYGSMLRNQIKITIKMFNKHQNGLKNRTEIKNDLSIDPKRKREFTEIIRIFEPHGRNKKNIKSSR